MKESYKYTKIQYEKYDWNICGDLKVAALLLGLQQNYTFLLLSVGVG